MKHIAHLTIEKLQMFNACLKAQEWFKENYPIGVYLTENDLPILIDKLLARKHSFFMSHGLDSSIHSCTICCMMWLLECIYGVQPNHMNALGMDSKVTRNKLLKTLYKDISINKPATKKKVTR